MYRHIFMYRYLRTEMAVTSLCPVGPFMLAITSIHLENAPQSPDPAFHHRPSGSVTSVEAGGLFLSRAVTEHSRAVFRCPSATKWQNLKVVVNNHYKRSVIYLFSYKIIISRKPYSSLLHLRKQLPKTMFLNAVCGSCAFRLR